MFRFVPLFVCCLALVAGCSGKAPDAGRANLETLAQYYNMYTGENKGAAPPDEASFKKYLAAKKVTDADKLFVSPRDQQPYKVKYGGKSGPDYTSKGLVTPDQAANQTIIAEEQTGVGGKRLAAYNSGVVKEI